MHFVVEKAPGVEVLKELMDANGLRQKDLAEVLGGESIVSLILDEKRQLNRQQMEKLGLASPLDWRPCDRDCYINYRMNQPSTMCRQSLQRATK